MTTAFDIALSAPVNVRHLSGIPIEGGVLQRGLAGAGRPSPSRGAACCEPDLCGFW
jgi:hypothetical protein